MLANVECGGLTFDASYDSGNAAKVEYEGDDEFSIWTHADMEGTEFENKNRTWWSFSIKGVTKSRMLHFNILNMNSQGKLLRADMRPVFRIWPSKPNWARIPVAASYTGTKEEDNFVLKFRHKCECEPGDTLYFAFCFPHTYADNIARLAWLDALFGLPAAHVVKPDTPTGQRGGGVGGGGVGSAAALELAHASQAHAATAALKKNEGEGEGSTSSGSSSSRTTAPSVALNYNAAVDDVAPEPAAAPPPAPPAVVGTAQLGLARKGSTKGPDLLARAAAAALAARMQLERQEDGDGGKQPERQPERHQHREGRSEQLRRASVAELRGGGGAASRLAAAAHRVMDDKSSGTASASAVPPKPPPGVYEAALAAASGTAEAAASPCAREIAEAAVACAQQAAPPRKPSGVYYHRELLCRSLEGRRVDLITISGTAGMGVNREAELSDGSGCCMPEGGERPRSFPGKTVFLLTARVHPGEVPASHVLDGFLQFILREDDPRARAMRDRFVFKLVPIINPDGVFRGHYRSDTRGLNLNRVYLHCRPEIHPAIHAITRVVKQLHALNQLQFYVDCHGHATKRGCFLYGNSLLSEPERMVDNVLYAKLCALNCRWFDFGGCVFSERNMYGRDKRDSLSKEGSGRVATYKMTNLTYVYTLECNYNTGRIVNRLAPPHVPKEFSKAAVSPPPPPLKAVSPKYTPECWRSVGKALALSALDIVGANPCSRLGPPAGGGYARLRATVSAWCKNYAKKEAKRKPVNRGGGSDEDDDEEGGEEEGEEDADEEDEEEEGGEEAADDVELRLGYGAVGVGGLLAAGRGAASAAAASAAAASAAAASAAAAQEPQGPLQDLSAADDLVGRFRNRFHLEGDDDDDAVQPPPAVAPALGAHTPLLGAAEPLPPIGLTLAPAVASALHPPSRGRSKSPRNSRPHSRSQSPRHSARASRPASGRR